MSLFTIVVAFQLWLLQDTFVAMLGFTIGAPAGRLCKRNGGYSAARSALSGDRWAPLNPPRSGDSSGALVARILEAGVRLLLRNHAGVHVTVSSELGQLAQGRVAGVHLEGREWRTQRGLTARRLVVAALDGAALDYNELIFAQRVTLTEPASGWAEAMFDARDFGNFLLYAPVFGAAPTFESSTVRFCPDGASIDSSAGRATFKFLHAGRGLTAFLEADAAGVPTVRLSACTSQVNGMGGDAVSPPTVAGLEAILTTFFQKLFVDLAGVELRFASLRFDHAPAGDVLSLRLRAIVRRIPNPFKDRI